MTKGFVYYPGSKAQLHAPAKPRLLDPVRSGAYRSPVVCPITHLLALAADCPLRGQSVMAMVSIIKQLLPSRVLKVLLHAFAMWHRH